jgi:hypothetical protein
MLHPAITPLLAYAMIGNVLAEGSSSRLTHAVWILVAVSDRSGVSVKGICPAHTMLPACSFYWLQMVAHLLAGWPVTSRSQEFVMQRTPCCHLDLRQDTLASMLKLPAAGQFLAADCVALGTTAAKAGSLGAFTVLCRSLPQLRLANEARLVSAVLRMYHLAVDKGWCQMRQ